MTKTMKRLKLKLRLWWLERNHPTATKVDFSSLLVKRLVGVLEAAAALPHDVPDLHRVKLEMMSPNFEHYFSRLERYKGLLKPTDGLSPLKVPEKHSTDLDEFFTTERGMIVLVSFAIESLIKSLHEIGTDLQKLEEDESSYSRYINRLYRYLIYDTAALVKAVATLKLGVSR